MLRFELSQLLDDPRLDLSKYISGVDDETSYPPEYNFTIYVVRDGDEVFYVGKSDDDCFSRLHAHLGRSFRGRAVHPSPLGELILRNLPESRQWTVELYSNEETKQVVPERFYEEFVVWPTIFAESAMIRTLKPYLNIQANYQAVRREVPKRYR